MADIAFGIVGKIVEVGLAIKEAVETVQQNKEDCLEIELRACRVSVILKRLEGTKMMDDLATRDALEDLEKILRHALTLVNACQERHIVCLFCKARDLSKKLRRVQEQIERRVMFGVFAIQTTIILIDIGCPPEPQENAGASSGDTTDDSRTEKDTKDNKVITAESDTPFASLDGVTKFTLAEIEDATNVFSQDNLVGQGGFGEVYKGVLRDGKLVAIKAYNKNSNGWSGMDMSRELDIVFKVQHRNIVNFLGYVHEAEGTESFLVLDYLPNGNLKRINIGDRADWSARLKLIDGIAQGLNYLHRQRICHMDLKPDNILLDSDMNAKIADFGISRMFDGSTSPSLTRTTTQHLAGTMGYMAPEYIFEGKISFKADVYAFGIIVLGTIIGGMCKEDPPASAVWASEALDKSDRQFKELFDPSLLAESQLKQIKACFDIGLRCAERYPEERPNMADVVEELDRIKDASAGSLKSPSLLRRLNTLTAHGRPK